MPETKVVGLEFGIFRDMDSTRSGRIQCLAGRRFDGGDVLPTRSRIEFGFRQKVGPQNLDGLPDRRRQKRCRRFSCRTGKRSHIGNVPA